jgi:putative transposase
VNGSRDISKSTGPHHTEILTLPGLPRAIRTDQGPEFTGKALDQWAYEKGIELRLIEAGKPTQNAYIESFNGKFRDERLNEHWFKTLAEARAIISLWRQDYNQARPHSALDYKTPAEVAAAWHVAAEIAQSPCFFWPSDAQQH